MSNSNFNIQFQNQFQSNQLRNSRSSYRLLFQIVNTSSILISYFFP